jgi:hypothetical protein
MNRVGRRKRNRRLSRAAGALGGLLLVVAITACGSNGRTSSQQTTTRASSQGAVSYSVERGALVTMRQYSPESLLWQTVLVRADGSALLTTLIGEISGAIRKPFQLSPDQAARLRRLVTAARPVARPVSGEPRAELYTLHISGMPSANIQGRMPKPLGGLVRFLSGLMLAHCC